MQSLDPAFLTTRFWDMRAAGQAFVEALDGRGAPDLSVMGQLGPRLRRRLLRMGRMFGPEVDLQRALELLAQLDPQACPYLLASQCQGVIQGHLPPERLEEIGPLIRSWPDDAVVQGHWGGALLWLGRFAEAETPLRRALELAPGDVPQTLWLAQLHQVEGRLDESRSLLHRLHETSPGLDAPIYALGQVALSQGDPQEALHWFARTEALSPGTSYLPSWTGLALAWLGRLDEAAELAEMVGARPLVGLETWLYSNTALILLAQQRPREAVAAQLRALRGARHVMTFLDGLRPYCTTALRLLNRAADGCDRAMIDLETCICFPS